MKEAIRVDLNGFYIGPELVSLETYGVTEIYETPTLPESEEGEESPEQPKPILVGYRIAIPVPPGLYKPRFDLLAWEAAVIDYDDAIEAYYAAMTAYNPESGDPEPQRPLPVDLRSFWIEGLTPEEIDAIRNAPQPPSIHDQVTLLQTESVDTMLALTEVYETNAIQDAQHEQEGVDTMLALTEAYELILQLTARIEALENGGAS